MSFEYPVYKEVEAAAAYDKAVYERRAAKKAARKAGAAATRASVRANRSPRLGRLSGLFAFGGRTEHDSAAHVLPAFNKKLETIRHEQVAQGKVGEASLLIPAGPEGDALLKNISDEFGDEYVGDRAALRKLAERAKLWTTGPRTEFNMTHDNAYTMAAHRMGIRVHNKEYDPIAFNLMDEDGSMLLIVPSVQHPSTVYSFPVNDLQFKESSELQLNVVILPSIQKQR